MSIKPTETSLWVIRRTQMLKFSPKKESSSNTSEVGSPVGIYTNPQTGVIYVCDENKFDVLMFNPSTGQSSTFPLPTPGDGSAIGGLDDQLFVPSGTNVTVYDMQGNIEFGFGSEIFSKIEFPTLGNVVFSPYGRLLFVVDRSTSSIVGFSCQ
jgi:hypothetical protein